MLIDGKIDFNETYIASKTKAAFVAEFKAYDHIFPGDADREKKLEDVWNQAKAQMKQAEPEVTEAPAPAAASKSVKITKTAKVGKTSAPKAEVTEPATPANNDGDDTGK